MKGLINKKLLYLAICVLIFNLFLVKNTIMANYDNEFVPGEVIVGMKYDFNESSFLKRSDIFPGVDILEIENIIEKFRSELPSVLSKTNKLINMRPIYLLKLSGQDETSVLNAIEILNKNPNVEYAEPNYIAYPNDTIPNDVSFKSQWGLSKIKMPQAWDFSKGSHSVNVGVIDSGIRHTHPDLTKNVDVSLGYNFGRTDDVNNANDNYGHGTYVSGIIGAVGNNNLMVTGVNWDVTMVPIKIAISNSNPNSNSLLQTLAVFYATELDLPIVNMSYSMIFRGSLKEAIYNYNGLFVAAAGNYAINNDTNTSYSERVDADNMIIVANSDSNDNLNSSSSYGKRTVDLAAPGTSILSTYPISVLASFTGTSAAAPHVTGAAALLKTYKPELTAKQIKSIILNNVDKIPSLSGKVSTGGRLNVYNAIKSIAEEPVLNQHSKPIISWITMINPEIPEHWDFGPSTYLVFEGIQFPNLQLNNMTKHYRLIDEKEGIDRILSINNKNLVKFNQKPYPYFEFLKNTASLKLYAVTDFGEVLVWSF